MLSEKVVDFFKRIWLFILSILGEDFVFLALLGFFMACIVHLINRGVAICNSARMWLYGQIAINQHYASQYFAWICLPVVLILFSTAFTDVLSPAAKGSGTRNTFTCFSLITQPFPTFGQRTCLNFKILPRSPNDRTFWQPTKSDAISFF